MPQRIQTSARRGTRRKHKTLAVLVVALLSGVEAHAASPGRIIGAIDGISHDGSQTFVSGWACQEGQPQSIVVAVFVDHSAFDTPKGRFVMNGFANLDSEPAVNEACGDGAEGKHRFIIDVSDPLFAPDRKLFLHGGRVAGSVPNAPIAGSGTPLGHFAEVPLRHPSLAKFPAPPGNYKSLATHPRVFTTEAGLKELVERINRPASYSARRFGLLTAQVRRDLSSTIDWDATYSGCDIDIYLHAFTIEPRGGYPQEIRTEDDLRSALHVKLGASAPAGAAGVAARLALYAALAKAGAALPPGSPTPAEAAALAKRILLAWSARGFRDEKGNYRDQGQFCEAGGKPSNPALHLSRGVVNTVQAQDLLLYVGVLVGAEAEQIDTFHAALFDVIRHAANRDFGATRHACERYANGQASVIESLLSIARLFDDRRRFEAVLSGTDAATPVLLPWPVYFSRALYGNADHPLECAPNTGRDVFTSHPAYTTPTVAAGEVQDRYRNDNPSQGIGYPMGTLRGLINIAEIMRGAGFDPYVYRGHHGQSIEMAIGYYACFAKAEGFYKNVTPENSRPCANMAQYLGRLVNEVEKPILIGAARFPSNTAFASLEPAAQAAAIAHPNPLDDSLFFGKWRD